MSFWVCFIFIFLHLRIFLRVSMFKNLEIIMAKIMAKNLENTAKNNENNENLEIVKKKLADTLKTFVSVRGDFQRSKPLF